MMLAALALACGARSGLEVEAIERDAGGTLDTLPCRWGVGEALELGRAFTGFSELSGAVDRDVDVAFVSARGDSTSFGALVALEQIPRLVFRSDVPGRVFSGPGGFLLQEGSACRLSHYDGTLSFVERHFWEGDECSLSQSRAGQIESFERGGMERVVAIDWPSDAPPRSEEIHRFERTFSDGIYVRADEDYFAGVDDGRLVLGRVRPPSELPARAGERVSGAPDRLRGGAVFLYRRETGWELVHVSSELREERLADLSTLAAEPIGRVVSNETEVLFPLADGSIAYVPVNRALIRYIAAFAPGPVEAMEIALRPGASAGVVVYAWRDGRRSILEYRTMVCNR